MTRRIVLSTACYRGFEFHYVLGLLSLGWPSDDVKARMAPLDVEITPAVARGYGGGKNLGQLFAGAVDFGADYVLTVDADMEWTAEHVCRILEAERYLSSVHGPVVVGSVYPQSRVPDSQIFCEMRDGVRLPMHTGEADATLADRLRRAVELADTPASPERYAEAWLLPTGFVLWPVGPYRTCAGDIMEMQSANTTRFWDNAMSDVAMAAGTRLFMDMGIDVGHMPLEPVKSVRQMSKLVGLE